MAQYTVAPAAQRDIDAILLWTAEHFGEDARRRYAALLVQAILDVAADPHRAGTIRREEIAPAARTYHLLHARSGVAASRGRVNKPRHLVLFRVHAESGVEILRVLHDRMDVARHVPDELRADASDD